MRVSSSSTAVLSALLLIMASLPGDVRAGDDTEYEIGCREPPRVCR